VANYGYGYPRQPLTGWRLFKRRFLNTVLDCLRIGFLLTLFLLASALVCLPFLWWGTILMVLWHFIAKVW
jgi:hypothetical protein